MRRKRKDLLNAHTAHKNNAVVGHWDQQMQTASIRKGSSGLVASRVSVLLLGSIGLGSTVKENLAESMWWS